jgi:sulfonate transport system substrate-binding protein
MTSRRAFLGAAAGALILPGALLGGAAASGLPAEVRIGYQKEGILAVVKQRATIEARLAQLGAITVRWVEFQYGPPMMEALGAGSIDIGSVGDTPPIFAQAAGAPVVYIAHTQAAQHGILVPANSAVRGVADLKGKTVAIARGSSAHNFTIQALKKAGLAFGDVRPAYLAPAEFVPAFTGGTVDAWAVWDPYFALAELRHGGRAIATSAVDYPSNSFYLANRAFAERQGRVLAAVVDELRLTYVWADQNRAQVAALIAEVTGVELPAQERTVRRLRIELEPIDDAAIAQQQEIADSFAALGLLPRPIVVRDAVWRHP